MAQEELIGSGEQVSVFSLLEHSLEQRQVLSQEANLTIKEVIATLKSLAYGYYYEQEYTNRKSEVKRKVYQVKPSFAALKFLLSLTNYDVKDNAEAALSTVRAVSGLAQQKLMMEQTDQAKAITAKTARETQAMDLSYATEDDFQQYGIALASACLTLIQSTPVIEFQAMTEESKQKWLERLVKRMKEIQADLLKVNRGEDDDDDE